MRIASKILVLGLIVAGGVAVAQVTATVPSVIARQDLMKINGMSAKILGDMAGGKVAFDAAAAEKAKADLIAAAAMIPAKFEANEVDPGSEAKPEVWTNWADFLIKATALETAATALDTSSAESIGAGMAGIGGACKACHTTYRL